MKIALFGATGPTGKYLVEEALGSGHKLLVYGRNASRVALKNENLRLVDGQIDDLAAVARVLPGADAVISALGPGYKSPPGLVITQGIKNIIAGMQHAGIKRLIQVSTASTPDDDDSFGKMTIINFLFSLLARNTYNDIRATAQAIRESTLDWTMVRVPSLYDGPPTTEVRVGYYGNVPLGMKLSRGNLAKFVLGQLTSSAFLHKAPGMSD